MEGEEGGGHPLEGWYETALPSLDARFDIFCARRQHTLPNIEWRPNKGRTSTPPRHNAISTTYFRPVAFSRFFLSDSFFFSPRAQLLTLHSPLPPRPDRTSSSTIARQNLCHFLVYGHPRESPFAPYLTIPPLSFPARIFR